MPELIDKERAYTALKHEQYTHGLSFSAEAFEKAARIIDQMPTIELGMNTSKIAKLCNEIEDIACDISRQTMNDIVSAESRMIFDKAKEITAEISARMDGGADNG